MKSSTPGGTAIFCVYTEMQLAIAALYFRKYLMQREVDPCFVLFRYAGERFRTMDLTKLPGRYHLFRNDLNQSVLFPDLSFLCLRSEKDVRYVAYPNSPILTHEAISNYFASKQSIIRIVISDGASIHSTWTPKARLKLLMKYIVRRFVNRVPNLSNRLLRSSDVIHNADILISTAPIDSTCSEFVNVHTLFADAESVRLALELFRVPEWQLNAFIKCNAIFFGQPRLKDRIDDRTYFDTLNRIVGIMGKHGGILIIKPHPAEDAAVYNSYVRNGVVICDNPIPAEFLLSSLHSKIVLSFYSSVSMMSGNETLTHIWLKNLLTHDIPIKPDHKILAIESLHEVDEILGRIIENHAAQQIG